jgi:hypothetical protein
MTRTSQISSKSVLFDGIEFVDILIACDSLPDVGPLKMVARAEESDLRELRGFEGLQLCPWSDA